MKQFLLPTSYPGRAVVTLSGADFHYLCRVRRLSAGDELAGMDPDGGHYRLRLKEVFPDRCVAEVTPAMQPPAAQMAVEAGAVDITLFQCLPKGSKTDIIVRQATEAGVRRIVPVISRYAVPRIEGSQAEKKKQERWIRIAREAVQQSGTDRVPEVTAPVPFDRIGTLWDNGEGSLGLYFHQAPLAQGSLHGYLSARLQRVALLIGPEGGLAESEIEQLDQIGFVPVYLGSRVLRAETAALYAIAAVQVMLLEKKTWRNV